jgi:hypothetical protein
LRASAFDHTIAFEPTTAFTGGRGDFFARAADYNVSLAADHVTFQPRSAAHGPRLAPIDIALVSADPRASLRSADPLPGRVNYLIGRDESQWRQDLPTFGRVIDRGVWPGIDVAYYGSRRHVEADFLVAAGADPHRIALDFEPAADVRLGDRGELSVSAGGGPPLEFLQPVAYQRRADGSRDDVASRYRIASSGIGASRHRVTIDVGPYDTTRPLVIDPEFVVLDFSTYIVQESSHTIARAVAVNDEGEAFVASTDEEGGHGFVTKYAAGAQTELFTTWFGNRPDGIGYQASTEVYGIALGPEGKDAYVTGYTSDPTFFTSPGALESADRVKRTGSLFVLRLTKRGSHFVYSTILTGEGLDLMGFYTADNLPPDAGHGIAVDHQGRAYVVGSTSHSRWTRTAHAIVQGDQPFKDMAFLTEFEADGSRVLYSTWIGGAGGGAYATGVALDDGDNVYVTGRTDSPSFPLEHPFQTSLPRDAIAGFVMKFHPTVVSITDDGFGHFHARKALELAYSTYLGGKRGQWETELNGIAVDRHGAMYVAGFTTSVDYPCTAAFLCPDGHTTFSLPAAIVTKIRPDGQHLDFSTFLQSTTLDAGITEANGIAVRDGNAYVTGFTTGGGFPVRHAFQDEICCSGGANGFAKADAFVTKLADDGAALVWSTLLGGTGDDEGLAIAVGQSGAAYVSGVTDSPDFPLKRPWEFQVNGTNGFLTKMHLKTQ